MVHAVSLHREYSREIAVGLRAHYHDCHIKQWCQGLMSSREFVELVEGMPMDSWLKSVAFLDADVAMDHQAAADLDEARSLTQQLLRGEIVTSGVREQVDGEEKVRRHRGP